MDVQVDIRFEWPRDVSDTVNKKMIEIAPQALRKTCLLGAQMVSLKLSRVRQYFIISEKKKRHS